jgi:hypothetical protein
MTQSFALRILKLGPTMWDLLGSAVGCFVFLRGFRLVAIGNKGSDAAAQIHIADTSPEPLVGIGAEVFLLTVLTSEALVRIQALRY